MIVNYVLSNYGHFSATKGYRYKHRAFPCGISMYVCIVTPIGLSPVIFFIPFLW
jgi:hypothetical protein